MKKQVDEGGHAQLVLNNMLITDVDTSMDKIKIVIEASPIYGVIENTRQGKYYTVIYFTSIWTNAGLMLAQRRRRWSNISPALGQRVVFAGLHGYLSLHPVTTRCLLTHYTSIG